MKLLKLSAAWCGPCKQLAMTMNGLEGLPEVQEIDIDKDYKTAQQYNVRGVPTLILLDDEGKEVKRVSGALTKEKLLEFVKT